MILQDDTNGDGEAGEPGDEATGLPWPSSWTGVYLFVAGCLVAWVLLLVALGRVYS